MSVKKCWSPLVEFHQWTSSLYIHASRLCNKNNFSSDNLILRFFLSFCFRYHGVRCCKFLAARWHEREIIEPCQHMCSTPRDPQNFQPARCRLLCRSCMVRSTQRPEGVAATWSDSNDSTGQLIKGAVRPKFPSKTFTGDMLESVSFFTKMFGLF